MEGRTMTEATPLTDEELRFAREDMGMCPPVTSQDVMHDRLLATISADREKIRELTKERDRLNTQQRDEIQRWREDALEIAASICDRYGLDGCGPAHDIRVMKAKEGGRLYVLPEMDALREKLAKAEKVIEAACNFRDNGTVLTSCNRGPCQQVIEHYDKSDPQYVLFQALTDYQQTKGEGQ